VPFVGDRFNRKSKTCNREGEALSRRNSGILWPPTWRCLNPTRNSLFNLYSSVLPSRTSSRTPCPLKATSVLLLALTQALASCEAPPESKQIQATYDKQTGKLSQLSYDANMNRKPDSWSYMDGARLLRAEIDKDEDGKIERWEYYTEDWKLEKVGLSRANDGKVDSWVYRGPDGGVARIEISTRRDGRVTRTEFYEKGLLARSEEDTDGNGVTDKWETFSNGALSALAFDTEGKGRPTRRLFYTSDGSLGRTESRAALDRTPPLP